MPASTAQARLLDRFIQEGPLPLILLANPAVMVWDLDSTVADTLHRQHLVPAIRAGGEGAPTWDDYSVLSMGDTPVEGSVALMRELSGFTHVAASGRSDKALVMTREWAARNGLPLADVILRPEGDHTPNGKWKVAVIAALRRAGADVRLFFEDWDESAAYIREHAGVPVVGINPFYPEKQEGAL
jgi:hypothetical protein